MEVPIPDDWDGLSFCRWDVCWPDSLKWKAILYGLLETPNQGRFWDFKTGNFLSLRAQFREAYDYNFNLKEVIMSCGDSGIAEAINNIAVALTLQANNTAEQNQILNNISLNNNVCCEQTIINSGGFVSGNVTQGSGEQIPIYGSQPPIALEPNTFPSGFDSYAEYAADKCQQANLIVSGVIGTLRGLGALGTFNGVALAGLIVASIITGVIFPPSAIPIAAALIGILAVEVTILAVVANEIEANRETWVCAIYNSEGAEAALAVIADLIDGLIATLETSSWIGFAIKQLLLLLFNSDTLNQAFSKVAHLVYPDADCSACLDDCHSSNIQIQFGTITSDEQIGSVRNLEITSQFDTPPGYHRITIIAPTGCTFDILSFASSGWDGQHVEPSAICGGEGHEYGFQIRPSESLYRLCTAELAVTENITVTALDSLTEFTVSISLEQHSGE